MYNKTNVKKQMFVIAMPYPKNKELPDILEEEDGQVMYFKREKDAITFLQDLYDERNIHIQALIDDNIQIMRVQWMR